eukprot:4996664-Alexandrium_andersonii.AAC.1
MCIRDSLPTGGLVSVLAWPECCDGGPTGAPEQPPDQRGCHHCTAGSRGSTARRGGRQGQGRRQGRWAGR